MIVYILDAGNKKDKTLSKKLLNYAYRRVFGKNVDVSGIHYNQYGKPYYNCVDYMPTATNGMFYYNISYSGNYICLCVDENEVGIDIEKLRNIEPRFSKRILAKNEKIINGNILHNWVIKEAYVKYLGIGLLADFRNISAEHILKFENIVNLSTNDYSCFLVSKKISPTEVVLLGVEDLRVSS